MVSLGNSYRDATKAISPHPFVSQEFNDVPRHESGAADTSKQEEVPDSDASPSFMDKVQVADRGLD
jgi:hypothetical protein